MDAHATATTPSAISPVWIRLAWSELAMPRSTAARTRVGNARSASTPTTSSATVPAMSQRTARNRSRTWKSLDGVRSCSRRSALKSGCSVASGSFSTRASSSGVALTVDARPVVGTITRSRSGSVTSGHSSARVGAAGSSVGVSADMVARYSGLSMISSRGPHLTTAPPRTTAT